jgi:type I restriction enzyme, S subunit
VSHEAWSRVPLTAVCTSEDDIKCGPFGTQLNKVEFREEGVPLWGIKQVNVNFSIPTNDYLEPRTANRLKQYDLRPGDIVMTRKGTVGNCAVYPEHYVVGIMHSDLLRLRVDAAKCEPAFLVHQLHHSPDVERQLALISGGAIMPGINVGKLKQLEVMLPPLAEQRRIAEVLDRAEALRTKRRAALAQLDSLTQSIFLDLFGDPATNPKRWPCKPVGLLASKFSDGPFGSSLKSEHYTETGVRVIRLQNIGVGEFVNDDAAYISEHHFAKLKKHECRPGDVLIGTMGDPNLRACIQPEWLTIALNKADCVLLRPDESVANAMFICALLNQPATERMAQDLIHGQTRARISMGRLRGLEVPVPPIALQREFARQITAVENLKTTQRASLAELDALFASLQHRAFRGEL